MPVTAKLSQAFYEKFGEDIANELVNWFNTVDATYRADLREFNELNFARFDAKLGQRLAEFEARFERRLAELEAQFERRLAEFATTLRSEIATAKSDTIKWLFGFWAPTMTALVALLLRG